MSLLGACLGTLLVLALACSKNGSIPPLQLVLAGAMITTLLTAIGQGMTLAFNLSTTIIGWQAGGLSGTNWAMLQLIAPLILAGLLLSQLLSHQLTILSLDEEVARGLGQSTRGMSLIFLLLVLLLSGAAVALVGSLALVGLVLPHLISDLTGKNYQHLLPLTGLLGACLLIWCDWLASHLPGTPLNALVSLPILPLFLILLRKGAFYEN